jgi:hypothetical protein
VRYLNVAHGAGWLVTQGMSLDVGVQSALLDGTRVHAQLGGSFAPLANRVWSLRASAMGASPAVFGDVSGYSLGIAYARSLRGSIDDHHRLELVGSIGVTGGVTKLDGGLAASPDKERFVRVPIVLSASAPFYWIALQAQASIEPNLLTLASADGWRAPHVGSLWAGALPVPWLSVLGGVETALGAPSAEPRLGLRLGVRL